jgi:hypothetical protein
MSDANEAEVQTKARKVTQERPAVRAPARRATLIVKYCRGRLGGSAWELTVVQRARAAGREVIVIDGDEASKTMRTYYPTGSPGAALVRDGRDVAAFKELMLEQMTLMAADGTSRVVDVSGGSRDLDDVLAELDLPVFCQDYGIDLVVVAMLGENREDFDHVIKAIAAGFVRPDNLLLVLNHGVLGKKNPEAAFLPLTDDQRYKDLVARGARVMHMPHLPVLDQMRAARVDVYATAASATMPDGSFQPIWQNMAKRWLTAMEQEFADAQVTDRLP